MADVDAITLSMGDLSRGGLTAKVAAVAILLAAASNTLTKAGIAAFVGGWRFGGRVGALFLGTLAMGAIAIFLTLR
jgi:uncharacterized membrane protein (DUF4010 family)